MRFTSATQLELLECSVLNRKLICHKGVPNGGNLVNTHNVIVTPWDGDTPPTERAIEQKFSELGLRGYPWSNGPFEQYAAHVHDFHKVIFVVRGSIEFGLPDYGEKVQLKAGDRMDLPRGTAHEAVVGPEGVVCLEAHRS
jgi:uncharacterized protein YjlB